MCRSHQHRSYLWFLAQLSRQSWISSLEWCRNGRQCFLTLGERWSLCSSWRWQWYVWHKTQRLNRKVENIQKNEEKIMITAVYIHFLQEWHLKNNIYLSIGANVVYSSPSIAIALVARQCKRLLRQQARKQLYESFWALKNEWI